MRRIASIALSGTLLLGACTAGATPDPVVERPDGDAFVLPGDLQLAAALSGFSSCDALLEHLQTAALEVVTPWGIGGGIGGGGWGGGPDRLEGEVATEGSAGDDAAPVPSAPADGTVEHSGTNNQEVGVDEPDRVKTDGDRLYLLQEDRLRIVDITGDEPRELSSLRLREGWGGRLLVEGDRLLVLSSAHAMVPFAGERIADAMPVSGGVTGITLVDVGDPSDPRVVERLTVDGATLSARLVDGVARIVIRTEQGVDLPWVYPDRPGLRAERRALEANREVIRASVIEDWLPYLVHETAEGRTTERTLLACNRIARPETFAGLGVLSVLTVDLAGGGILPGEEAVGLLAGGDTVYASAERLYVATTRWVDWGTLEGSARRREIDRTLTEIHSFDIGDPAVTTYVASGEVPGNLIGQWAMSEHEGRLRVASTVGDTWGWTGRWDDPSESVVTVLEPQGSELAVVGQVSGLGVTERIYAVRFIGDVGYVVTFRETDPLYTLDLSDPTDPEVTGELKITGYSAYLHPMGEDLLLGVGQDADEAGRTKGTQLSLFDVSDPSDPRRIDQVTLADGSSEVEYDHHAFLHWPATGLTVVPFQRWSYDERSGTQDMDAGALAFHVAVDEGIVPVGTLSHLPLLRREWDRLRGEEGAGAQSADEWIWNWGWQGAISRSMVRGERLVTVSEAGIAIHALDDLEVTGWLRFER